VIQFTGECVNRTRPSMKEAAHRQSLEALPTLDCAHFALEVYSDFFPGVEAVRASAKEAPRTRPNNFPKG
jgi:hypothetical protein